MSQQNVEVVRQHIEAYAAGDAGRALSFLHPAVEMDISRVGMIDEEVLHGQAELAQYVRRFRGAFRDWRFEIRRLVEINDSVLALVREAGRGKGSGIETERRFGLVYTLRAGKSCESRNTRRTPRPSKPPDCASRRVGFVPTCCYPDHSS
jgi:ketosteroid isomerase-like protein